MAVTLLIKVVYCVFYFLLGRVKEIASSGNPQNCFCGSLQIPSCPEVVEPALLKMEEDSGISP